MPLFFGGAALVGAVRDVVAHRGHSGAQPASNNREILPTIFHTFATAVEP
jgi:hypothetical protein